ncbi:glycosyl transferase [Nocardia blacklockiae]|uniref:glycosyl transferase n=1 Tax=Nocardia blacklockiae TaxID=480036 RepID=UPI001E5EFA26
MDPPAHAGGTATTRAAVRETRTRLRARLRASRTDLLTGTAYLVFAVVVLSGQWRDTEHGYLIKSGQDQSMWEWFFAVTAHSVAHLESPLGTTLQNFPAGVNMMANTAMFGVGVPLTPVTMLFGPTTTYVLVLTAGLAATAFAWYWLFSRELVSSRFAAAVGGVFCGFAPAMISHANAHPNFVLLALLPVLALVMIRKARRALDGPPLTRSRRLREAVVLGLLVALQIALGEEPLLIFALAFGLFALVYYLHDPRAGWRVLRGVAPTVGLAALITLALTAIPLWWQFFGPQSYRSIDHGPTGNDLKALVQFPAESLGGMFLPGQNVGINPTEDNSYFGWPLLALLAVTVVLLWRRGPRVERFNHYRAARAATAVIAVFTVLSLGVMATLGKRPLGVSLPWKWLERVPLLNTVLETRFSMAAIPAIAVILALGTERAIAYARASLSDPRPLIWFGALTLVLAPLVPTILPVTERTPTPAFFTDGTVRDYVSGGSVVVAPPPSTVDARALRWQVDSGLRFPLAGGYFVGPAADKKGQYGPDIRPTALLMAQAQQTDRVPVIDDATRERALADLNYWKADVIVLPPVEHGRAIHATLDQLLGFPGRYVDGVWVWDVRGLV